MNYQLSIPTSVFGLIAAALQTFLVASPVWAQTPREIIQEYDARLLDELRDYDGNPADLLAGSDVSKLRDIAREVFTGNWDLVKQYSDQRLAALPERSAELYSSDPAHVYFTDGEIATAMEAAGPETRAAFRLWEPESIVGAFSATAYGHFMNAEELALNTVVSGITSQETFKTRWRDLPALGQDIGFWTFLVSYRRDSFGHFLPMGIGAFER